MNDQWVKLAATFFYVGLLPAVPGTWGSLAGVFLFMATAGIARLQVVLFFVLWVLGLWAGGRAERLYSKKDPSQVVIDEVAGVFVVFAGVPLTPWTLGLGFLLYRGFDTFKPFGLRRLERLAGGWGIMLDDLGAGVYVNILLQIFHQLNILQ